jgi:hypothetical protein
MRKAQMTQLTAKRRRLIWATNLKQEQKPQINPSKKQSAKLIAPAAEWRKLARQLFDQQLWCWGQDIIRPNDNLLLRYGFTKTPPPKKYKAAASLYRYDNKHQTVMLRGFGMLFGNTEQGYLFLDRASFRAKWFDALPAKLWDLEDLVQHARQCKLRQTSVTKAQLLAQAVGWVQAYEEWVVSEIGLEWRTETLQKWGRRCCTAREISGAWRAILNQL